METWDILSSPGCPPSHVAGRAGPQWARPRPPARPMSRGPWRPHAPSAHLAPRLRGRLWLCPPHVARGSVSTSQPPGPLDDPQSLLYKGPKVTPCPPRDSAAASQESRSQARASVAAGGHLVVPGGLCSLRRQARELTRTLQNSPEPRRRPPVFLGQRHPHLLSQEPPQQARRWLTPKALVKERNVSRTLGGLPGGSPEEDFGPPGGCGVLNGGLQNDAQV